MDTDLNILEESLFSITQKSDTTTGSVSSLENALRWFESCSKAHAKCGRHKMNESEWLPTRLIDLGSLGSLQWKLCVTAESGSTRFRGQYLSLSYRWGLQPKLLLLSSTLEKFQHGQCIDQLPRTFREFVIVARLLAIRYVWIDALCIIQDSTEDWEREALNMRRVYANAACTIAASASSDEEGGLFRSRIPEVIQPAVLTIQTGSKSQKLIVFERDYWDQHLHSGPLNRRGWVFQERHLSQRVIHFTRYQIMWECLEGARCEAFPKGLPFHANSKDRDSLFAHAKSRDTGLLDNGHSKISPPVYLRWRDLVKMYSRCAFTKIEDRLVAFSGIAKVFQDITSDDYHAGLWRSRFVEGLDWRVFEPAPAISSIYVAPSWSWASINGPVEPGILGAGFQPLLEVLDIQVEHPTSDVTGSVLSGRLELKGRISSAIWKPIENDEHCTLTVMYQDMQVRIYPDKLGFTLTEGQCLNCLPVKYTVSNYGPITNVEVFIMVLERLNFANSKIYRRVGHFIITDPAFFSPFGLYDLGVNKVNVSHIFQKVDTIMIV